MLDLSPESVFAALGINNEKLAAVDRDVFMATQAFYGLEYTTAFPEPQKGILRAAHTEFAELIGESSDIIFLNRLLENGTNLDGGIVDVLPLRGAVSLVPGTETEAVNHMLKFSQEFGVSYSVDMIGVKRNGPEAHIYFPTEHKGFDHNKIYRIKDFGIATGGTAEELITRLMNSGVDPHQIYIQGAVGTEYASKRITNFMVDYALKRFPDKYSPTRLPNISRNVMFSVKGEMPIERGDESQPDKKFYLDTILDGNTKVSVNAKDWGDVTCTDMVTADERAAFIARANKIHRTINGTDLPDDQQEALRVHYEKVAQAA